MKGMTGHETALAMQASYYQMADYIAERGAEDAYILGTIWPPKIQAHLVPVIRGTDEERIARIDAWAMAHGVKAGRDPQTGHYRAVVMFGVIPYVVYTIPERAPAGKPDPASREDDREFARAA